MGLTRKERTCSMSCKFIYIEYSVYYFTDNTYFLVRQTVGRLRYFLEHRRRTLSGRIIYLVWGTCDEGSFRDCFLTPDKYITTLLL